MAQRHGTDRSAEAVGQRVRELREASGMTQRKLAAVVGLRVEQLSLVESGRRVLRVSALPRIAKALGVAPSELVAPLDGGGR